MTVAQTPSAQTPAAKAPHIPVLLNEVVAALAPQAGDVIVDATFGAGGYTRALLDAGATVHAFDRDPDAIAAGQKWDETREIRRVWCCIRAAFPRWLRLWPKLVLRVSTV